MTKFVEQIVNLLPAPPPAPPVKPVLGPDRPMLTRDEVEGLFSRELGRKRLH